LAFCKYDDVDADESDVDVSVVENRLMTREVKLIARTPQSTRSWCGPDHGVEMRRRRFKTARHLERR
jgi:hypothetical protein